MDNARANAGRFLDARILSGVRFSADRRRLGFVLWSGLVACVFAWAYWPTLRTTWMTWRSDPDYSHGFLVLPIALAIWLRRRSVGEFAPAEVSVGGLSLIALASLLRVAAGQFYLLPLDAWSIPVWLAGVVWTFAGWRTLVRALPALAFLWFAAPLPERFDQLLGLPLQMRAAAASAWILQCLCQPAVASGTTLLLGAEVFEVEHACSGLRMFFGSLAMATAFAALGPADRFTKLALVLLVAPIAMLANVVRIVTTALLYQHAPTAIARRFVHDFAGLSMVAVALALFATVVGLTHWVSSTFARDRQRCLRWLPAWPVVIATLVLIGTVWHDRQQQEVHRAMLEAAATYEQRQDWATAAGYLRRYVQLNPADKPALGRLAEAMGRAARGLPAKQRALTVMTAAWRANPDNLMLARQQAQLALELHQDRQVIATTDSMLACTQIAQREHAETRRLAARWRAAAMYQLMAESDPSVPFTWNDVADALRAAVELDSSFPQHALRLALVYREHLDRPAAAERVARADRVIDRLVETNPDLAEAWLVRYRYRRMYHPNLESSPPEQETSIDADLDRALDLDSKSSERNVHILVAAAERMRGRGELDAALALYQAALQANSLDVRPYLAISEIWTERGTPQDRQQALDVLQQGLRRIGADEVPLLLPLIEQLVALERPAEADRYEQRVEASLRRYPEPLGMAYRIQLQHVRSWRLARHGSYAQAGEQLRGLLESLAARSVRSSPDYVAQAWASVGQYARMANDWDRAADAYQRAAALDDAWRLEYRWALARRTEVEGDWDQAQLRYRELAGTEADAMDAWLGAARVALRQQVLLRPELRDWAPLRRALASARSIAGDRADEVWVLEANQALISGRSDQAVRILEEGIQRRPDSALVRRALALLCVRRGEAERALEVASAESSGERDSNAAVLLRSEILQAVGREAEAIELLRDALAATGETPSVTLCVQLASQYLQSGQWSQARDLLDRAAEIDPRDLRVTAGLSEVAWRLQDWKRLEQCEATLRAAEGSEGALWRTIRIRRLLAQSLAAPDGNGASRRARSMTSRANWKCCIPICNRHESPPRELPPIAAGRGTRLPTTKRHGSWACPASAWPSN